MESTHAKKSFQCNMCGKGYSRNDKLQIHMQTHNVRLNRIICETCRQEFPGKPELRDHRLRTHEGK